LGILIIANLYPDERQPTFGTFVAEHASALRRAGAEVGVVAITGVAVSRAFARKYLWLAARAIGYALRARIRRRLPQVVEAHVAYPTALLAWVVARLLGASLVIYCHGSDVTGVAARSRFHHALATWVFARAQLVVSNSSFLRELLVTRYRVRASRLVVLPPGVNLRRFGGASEPRRLGEVLYVGWLLREKGVFELVEAVGRLRDSHIKLRIAGGGPERAALEDAARVAGIDAEFLGAVAPTDVGQLMAEAAVVAVPSIGIEGLGLVALEAMAAGALVVAAASGGLSESVIDGETGWLVPPGDVDALTAALRDALTTAQGAAPSRLEALRRRATEKAAEHDIDAIARRTLTIYASLGGGTHA
jgi:glycosyltransferase involved in cell wall biosynthesis